MAQFFILKNNLFKFTLVLFFVMVMTHLNAAVDHFLHADIPYFDKEHLIVGGITGFVSMIGFGLLLLYAQSIESALSKIKTLEPFLPICTICKKIREPGSDPEKQESWQAIDSYITEKTTTMLSHGICPECAATYYAEYMNGIQ
jgi:hypothetical protein